jgi:hypothetical protein
MVATSSTWVTRSSFGSWNPQTCLVAALGNSTAAANACQALRALGFSDEHLQSLSGQAMQELRDGIRGRLTRLRRALYFLVDLTDNSLFEEEYLQEARNGNLILVVRAPAPARAAMARAILEHYGAYALRYYGRWTVTGFVAGTPAPSTAVAAAAPAPRAAGRVRPALARGNEHSWGDGDLHRRPLAGLGG